MDILKWATEIENEVIGWRRKIYEHPELSDYEYETLALIRQVLTESGVAFVDVPGGGIMAFIEGNVPGKTVFLRADIDALPIEEDTCNWAQPKACLSKVPGVAHLCGHDAHTAMLMGAAKVLQAHKDLIEGRVILFFEQGEENGHGDIHMMEYIQKNNIHIDGCWAMHCFPTPAAGHIGLRVGGIFAGDMEWNVTVKAKDGRATTAIDCCASMLRAFHSGRMNGVTPFEGLTITCCIFQADQEEATCRIGGICRFHHRDKAGLPMKRTVRRIVENTAAAYGCELPVCDLSGPKEGLLNDPTCYQIAKDAISKNLGPEFVCDTDPTMGGESFTALSSYYPSVMALLGMRDEEKGFTAELHSPKFEANEVALKYGVAAHVSYALAFLQHKEPIPFEPFVGDFDAFLQARQAD